MDSEAFTSKKIFRATLNLIFSLPGLGDMEILVDTLHKVLFPLKQSRTLSHLIKMTHIVILNRRQNKIKRKIYHET